MWIVCGRKCNLGLKSEIEGNRHTSMERRALNSIRTNKEFVIFVPVTCVRFLRTQKENNERMSNKDRVFLDFVRIFPFVCHYFESRARLDTLKQSFRAYNRARRTQNSAHERGSWLGPRGYERPSSQELVGVLPALANEYCARDDVVFFEHTRARMRCQPRRRRIHLISGH